MIVAQLKATSVTSYTLANGGNTLSYPTDQFSISGDYGAHIYFGTGQWSRGSSLSRSKNSLTPISTNTFLVFSDTYGSQRSSYETNIFFSINPSGQTIFANVNTGSKMVITWSGLTHYKQCQVWVEGDSTAELLCETVANSLTITSPYKDYTTSKDIMVSMGITNPTSTTTTFTVKLYSYYYSSSRYSLTISRTATYSTDTTYNSGSYTKVSKSSVRMYPFESRVSTIANAPLRIRFKLSSSSISSTNGKLELTYNQIGYSS